MSAWETLELSGFDYETKTNNEGADEEVEKKGCEALPALQEGWGLQRRTLLHLLQVPPSLKEKSHEQTCHEICAGDNDARGGRPVPGQEPKLGLQEPVGAGRREARGFSLFPQKGGSL